MRTVLLIVCVLAGLQQAVPKDLPPARKVTDPARPDFGYMQPWAGDELTIAIVLGADCSRCVDAIPFYKRLTLLPGIDGKARRVVLMADGGIAPVVQAVRAHPHSFSPAKTVSYPSDDRFGVRALPAVFVFDGRWKRRGEWQGPLDASQEAAVVSLVERIAGEAKRRRP